MTALTPPTPLARRVSSWFFRHPRLKLMLMLAPVVVWLGVVYLGSLVALLAQSFFRLDAFSGQVVREFTLETYGRLFTRANFDVVLRTASMAAAVTIAAAVFAYPLAYYMARVASPRLKAALYVAVLMPLWSSYIVRVYSWKIILEKDGVLEWTARYLGLGGVLDWVLDLPGIGGPNLSFSLAGMFLVFLYLWLPFMILPLQASLERIPHSLTEASADLGGRPALTFRRIVFPIALPGLIAGSIFTFSLTLGDFIVPQIIGNGAPFIGLSVYRFQGVSGNIPLAAAFAVIPVVIMAVYLTLAKRAGAFEEL